MGESDPQARRQPREPPVERGEVPAVGHDDVGALRPVLQRRVGRLAF